jgi:voltage-gated sodium channel
MAELPVELARAGEMGYRGAVSRAADELVPDVAKELGQYKDVPQAKVDGAAEAAKEEAIVDETGHVPWEIVIKRRKKFCESLQFNAFIGFFIVANLLFIGIENDFGYKCDRYANPPCTDTPAEIIRKRWLSYVVEIIFCIVFLGELIIRVRAYRIRYFCELSNIFDFTLVVIAIIDPIAQWAGYGGMRVFSILRVLRMLRLVRFVRLLKMFQELWLIVSGLLNSMRTLGWVALLLTMFIYVPAIYLTVAIGQNTQYELVETMDGQPWPYTKLFGKVPRSMLTLFQVVTLDSWADEIARPAMDVAENSWLGMAFILFILFATYGIMNIVVGVIVEHTLGTASVTEKVVEEEEAEIKKQVLRDLRKLFELTDSDKSGTITRDELQAAFDEDAARDKFDELGIPIEDLNQIFRLMDPTGKGVVSLDDFIGSCMQLISGYQQKDIMQLAIQVESLSRRMEKLDGALHTIESDTYETKRITIKFMEEVVPKLVGNAHLNTSANTQSFESGGVTAPLNSTG